MSEFVKLLQNSDDGVELAFQFLLTWIAVVDDEYSSDERSVISRVFGDTDSQKAGVIVRAAQQGEPDDIAVSCEIVGKGLTDQGKDLALDLGIMVAVADGLLSVGENHALRFVADVLGKSSAELMQKYEAITGGRMPGPRDLSSAHAWAARTGRGNGKAYQRNSSDGESSQRRSSRDNAHSSGESEQKKKRRTSKRMTSDQARDILGVSEHATDEEIKAAYRQLAQRTHPDRFRTLGDDAVATAQAWFHQVQQAYETLRDRA